jgi:hypothetical protein
MLKDDKDYHLLLGISLLYVFRFLNIGLLDYMAVAPKYQRRGIGKDLFRFTLGFSSQVRHVIGLMLKIQKENVPDLQESLRRKDRIRFYAKLGAKVLDGVNYLLPSQNGGRPEEMYLIMVPLTEIHSLPKRSVIQYVSAIYPTIYQYKNNDLLNTVFDTLPATIMLRDI